MKKLIQRVMLLSLMLCSSVHLISAEKPNYYSDDGLSFYCYVNDANEYVAELTGYYKDVVNVVIPEKVTRNLSTYTVTSIGDHAFNRCESLTTVEIPDAATSIGYYAFGECKSLTAIELSKALTEMGNFAFSYCTSLTSINIPEALSTISWGCFQGCTSLTSLTIPKTITTIDSDAFRRTGLLSLNIPSTVTEVGGGIVADCPKLRTLTIENAEGPLKMGVFFPNSSYTSNLEVLNIDRPLIGENIFANISSLTTVNLSGSINTVNKRYVQRLYGSALNDHTGEYR